MPQKNIILIMISFVFSSVFLWCFYTQIILKTPDSQEDWAEIVIDDSKQSSAFASSVSVSTKKYILLERRNQSKQNRGWSDMKKGTCVFTFPQNNDVNDIKSYEYIKKSNRSMLFYLDSL